MSNKQKSGGGSRKIGHNKGRCESYRRQGKREKAKLKHFKKHNIPKDSDEKTRQGMISDFMDKQNKRKGL